MRSFQVCRCGEPMQFAETATPKPKGTEVVVKTLAAGVCHSDLHPARGDWPMKVPVVLGHEGAGIVRDVGPNVTRVRKDDHVVLCWAPARNAVPS